MLTPEQQAAVDARDENFLIAAAAGSGKTHTLTKRVLKLVEDGCNVDEMLIVTFTRAAAQEMRTRIQNALSQRLEETFDDEIQNNLARQLILLNGAQITTLHSFCQSVLRRNFASIDLDPKFRSANDNELDLLKREVIEELFEENYSSGSEVFQNFTDEFGGNVHGDEKIHDMIINLHKFSLSMAHPEIWLENLPTPYNLPVDAKIEDTIWFRELKSHISDALKKISDDCAEAQRLAYEIGVAIAVIDSDSEQILPLKNFSTWDDLREKISAIHFVDFDKRRKFTPEQKIIRDKIKNLRDGYKKIVENLRDKIFIADESKILADLRELHEPISELVRVTKNFAKKFAEAKRERGIIDFSDMEHLTLKIFENSPAVAENYREKFKFIMVDEYQDTNGVQEAIIQKISRGDNLFFVGDVKQSIYRFRLVDSKNFRDKMTSYRCINLSKNFRSRKPILDAVNEVFSRLMIGGGTEIVYDSDSALKFGATYENGQNFFDERPEMFIIDSGKSDGDDSKSIELEMRFIADKIHKIIASNKLVRDGEIYRPVELRDIVILHHSPKPQAFEILDTLKRFGVPAFVPEDENYFKAAEIQVMLSLLTILDNARQDIPLAAVMLSPIGKFSAEELANLRLDERNADFFTAVERGTEKCKNFLSTLDFWREEARQLSVPELLSKLYRETGYYDFVGKLERGAARQANLRMLIDRARTFEDTNARGLSRFVEFITKLRNLGKDLSTAVTSGENSNVVRVVTIHKSKGLEYPVVFVAGLGKGFNSDDYTKGIIFCHSELGIGAHRTPKNSRMKVKTLATQAVAKKIRDESSAENLRTLYVAMTRAKEKLILVGTATQSNLEKTFPVDKIDASNILSAGNPFYWLLPLRETLSDVINVQFVPRSLIDTVIEREIDVAQEKILQTPEKFIPSTKNIPAKLSVTELKRRAALEEFPALSAEFIETNKHAYRRPNFLQTKKLSGAEFGTLMHKVMQSLNLTGDLSAKGISAQVDELARRELIEFEHVKLVRTDEIAKFFKSPLGQRLLAAQEIYREMPFSRTFDAKNFFNVDEKIFVQGIIDLLFKDAAGRWVLLDYKTDRDSPDIAARYRMQIDLYASAIEALLKLKISEKYLYMLGSGRLVKM